MSNKKMRKKDKNLLHAMAMRGFSHNILNGVDRDGMLREKPSGRNIMASNALLRSVWRHALDSAQTAKMELGWVNMSLLQENSAKQGLMASHQNGVDLGRLYLDSDVNVEIFSKDGIPIPRYFTSVVHRLNILQKVLRDHVPREIYSQIDHPGIILCFKQRLILEDIMDLGDAWFPLGWVGSKPLKITQEYLDSLSDKPEPARKQIHTTRTYI